MRTRFLILLTMACGWTTVLGEQVSPKQLAFFEKRVRPILVDHCYECHSADTKQKGGLKLDTKSGWEIGGESGPVIVPGKPDDSLLLKAIRHQGKLKMPKKKLPDVHINTLTAWIKMGAPDPRIVKATLIRRDIDIAKGREFWAYQPPTLQTVPQVKDAAWSKSDIDRLVLARLESKGLSPVADAKRQVLIRRLYFDLIGLPPSPEQVRAFVDDNSANAIGKVVDQLLASPRFGERWGRHWLDVARYGESVGMERNFSYPVAWRYRDYVIDSYNRDKPFKQFVIEQIAGDLLPHDSIEDGNAKRIATGFLALGPKSLNERNKAIFQMDLVDEQIDTTTRAFMGTTVSCARCHDHKFDPIPTEDYYAIAGIFKSTKTLYGTSGTGNRQPAALMPLLKNESASEAGNAAIIKQKSNAADRQAKLIKEQKSIQKQIKELNQRAKRLQGVEASNLRRQVTQLKSRVKEVSQSLQRVRKKGGRKRPKVNYNELAMGVEDATSPADCRLHIRGNVQTLGKPVPRGYLQVLHVQNAKPINAQQSGRLELAQWIASDSNPLTARVAVNRIWLHLFGAGLVRTPDNFGQTGERPDHQELLDYLAVRFVRNGWSVKKTIREIVTSRVYQLSSESNDSNFQVDPENRMHWHMAHRRLDAESIRDAVLSVSGTLDLQPAGQSVVMNIGDVNVGQSKTTSDRAHAPSVHRSVYLPILRGFVPDMLKAFDFAEPSLIVGARSTTTVPTQALFMMNSRFIATQSAAFANRIIKEADSNDAARVKYAYNLALSRDATDQEQDKALAYVRKTRKALGGQANESRVWPGFCQAIFASAEFRYLE